MVQRRKRSLASPPNRTEGAFGGEGLDARGLEDQRVLTKDGVAIWRSGDTVTVDFEEGSSYADKTGTEGGFDANLAEQINAKSRVALGEELLDMVEIDRGSRSDWEERLKNGLEILGIKSVPKTGIFLDKGANVNHPGIAEACVRFQANAMEELFPPSGPVKASIAGEATPDMVEQGRRVEDFLNYQFTELDEEYYWSTDSMMLWLPYAGSAFKKVYYDHQLKRTVSRFVTPLNVIVPYDADSLKDASRYSHEFKLTANQIDRRVADQEYVGNHLLEEDVSDDSDKASDEIRDESDDRTVARHEDDQIYTLFEINIETRLPWDVNEPYSLPYLITVEKDSGDILNIRRNWDPEDPMRLKRDYFVHYKFLPGLGFYGWGYLHLIGSLGEAASGALRLILDGSMTSSLQGGFKSSNSRGSGEFVLTPGVYQEIDMPAEELSKSFFTPPFKPPSEALFKTLNLLTEGIERIGSTMEAMTGGGDNKGPVGTTLALIEQASKMYSGIHKRLHVAARQEFKLVSNLNYEFMEGEEYPYNVGGEDRSVLRSDFDGRVDILPVSDPNIFSNVQRIAQSQGVLELLESAPDLYDEDARREAHRDMIKALKVADPERFLPDKKYKRFDAVAENQMMMVGRPIQASIEQDHQSHMAVHYQLMQESENLDPEVATMLMPVIMAHIAEHYQYAYRFRLEQELGIELPPFDVNQMSEMEELPVELDMMVSRAVAENISPPAQAPSEEADEEQQKLDNRQAEHDQKMQQRDEEHQQKGALEADKAEMKRKADALDAGLLPSEAE